MTVIVERDTSVVELFQSALGGGNTIVDSLEQLTDYLRQTPQEYAVVLGPSVRSEAATDFAAHMRVNRPALGVILVRTRVDSSVLGEALRAGMREVVESRDLTGLADAVRRAYSLWQAMSGTTAELESSSSHRGVLFTVFSTKGGVGKSTLATNLGVAIADTGKRVCLVDLDVQSGDVAIMLQLFPSLSLSDLTQMAGAIDPSGLETLLTEHSDRLSVLAAPMQLDARALVSPDTVSRSLQVLKTMVDVVVVDTSGAFDDYALNALDHSDLILLIGTLDIPALKSMKVAIDTLDLLNIPRSHWRLVLNRADEKVGLSPAEYEQTLGLEIATSLPSSREVLAAVNRGEAIVTAHPKHPVSQGIRDLAAHLVDGQEVPAGHAEDGQSRNHAHEPRRVLRKKVRRS